ncbi:hypothetical protein [Streptomyces aureoversilis]|uniref:Secreted protein n=1 Tax=Streptomyces aureoversilis TaxID=67277 RepID=A0ABV9ZSD5_9ACTN
MRPVLSLAVPAVLAFAVLGPASPAGAADHGGPVPSGDAVVGGLLSNLGSKNADGHSNTCGGPRTNVAGHTECVTDHGPDHGKGSAGEAGAAHFGGVLSNVASGNASDHSNSCGNGLVSVLSHTTCVVNDHR